MAQNVANKIKSIQILEKPSSRAATASAPSDEQTTRGRFVRRLSVLKNAHSCLV